MQTIRLVLALAAGLAASGVGTGRAGATAAREYLDEARAATVQIDLAGDQSAALQAIALTLAHIDPPAALDIAARMRRPSDAARVLGAAAVALGPHDPETAEQIVTTAARLLLRIADADQRLAEQRLLLREVAPLGTRAVVAAPELTPGQAQHGVALALAESDPAAALALAHQWQFRGIAADEIGAAVAERLALVRPEQAAEAASEITSARLRDRTFRRIAELRPPEESAGIAARISDPFLHSAVLASAAARLAPHDAEAALALAAGVPVAPSSATAGAAAALALSDPARARDASRGLAGLARSWALARIALDLAAADPTAAERLLDEAGADPQTVARAAARMAPIDFARAERIVNGLPARDRDPALALLARAVARRDPQQAKELAWRIADPRWRAHAVEPLALALARQDPDAATGAIGLVSDAGLAGRIRASVAAVVAPRDSALAARLLAALPESDYRTEHSLNAAVAMLAAGGRLDVAADLASLGLGRDLALRWTAVRAVDAGVQSPRSIAAAIAAPYPKALALVDIARESLGLARAPRPAPERLGQVRPIVEWETL